MSYETQDEWGTEQDVELTISATVNGVEVYSGTFYSVDSLEEDLRKPERAIQQELDSQYEDYVSEQIDRAKDEGEDRAADNN
jgi:hypothetical protein